eukprot:Blabericola_migrator_1__1509@NODE_139_length_13119_cov_94_960389_g121_i0_p15_GENE_NODE_139_length_13119_cov_94_960389_g121_i0NODE_139_length_13119_cov_94_960389_g121_i0_p15_ORF_typecomplete_len139_score23_20DUF148/PF02520_17/0_039MIPT3_C/PF17749_1/0_095_NODE_139_length_13119_cov_94_960389_g121_i01077311189
MLCGAPNDRGGDCVSCSEADEYSRHTYCHYFNQCHQVLCSHCLLLGSHAMIRKDDHPLISTVEAFKLSLSKESNIHLFSTKFKDETSHKMSMLKDAVAKVIKNFESVAAQLESIERSIYTQLTSTRTKKHTPLTQTHT